MMTGVPFQAETTVYVIVRCKLDERVTTEAEFSPEDSPSIRVEGKLENEYTVSVKAPGKSPQVPPEIRHHAREEAPSCFFYLSVYSAAEQSVSQGLDLVVMFCLKEKEWQKHLCVMRWEDNGYIKIFIVRKLTF